MRATATARAAVAISTPAQTRAGTTVTGAIDISLLGASARRNNGSALQSHATPAALTCRALADELDARDGKGLDQLHQRVDVAADDAVARFHALDGGQRETRAPGKLALIEPQERPRRPHLGASYHVSNIRIDRLSIPIHA